MFFLFNAFNVFLFTQQNVMKKCVHYIAWKNVSLWSKKYASFGCI